MKIITLFFLLIGASYCSASDTVFSKEVNFFSQGYKLSGELLLPKTNKPVPVIIFLVGSGGNSSYRTNYKRFLHENLETKLISEGIALFYFDKRGVGNSEGSWYETGFHERALDAKAAIDGLKSMPEIDKSKIGVMGHSQGGWIAQLIAARHPADVAFMISLAGPTFSVKKQLTNDFQSDFVCKGIRINTAHKKAKRNTAIATIFTTFFPFKKEWKQLNKIKSYHPGEAIQQLKCPSIFYFGENDPLVNPDWAINDLNTLFETNLPSHISYLTVKGANHSFMLADPCHKGPSKQLQYSTEFQEHLKNWVLNRVQ